MEKKLRRWELGAAVVLAARFVDPTETQPLCLKYYKNRGYLFIYLFIVCVLRLQETYAMLSENVLHTIC